MTTSNDISKLCNEFTNALTEALAENAVGPARRSRLARARAAVKKHLEYSEHKPGNSPCTTALDEAPQLNYGMDSVG